MGGGVEVHCNCVLHAASPDSITDSYVIIEGPSGRLSISSARKRYFFAIVGHLYTTCIIIIILLYSI